MAYKILYPDEMVVTDEWVMARYADMMADDFIQRNHLDLSEPADNNRLDAHYLSWKREEIVEAKRALEDAGLVTFKRE